jgi:putative tricarboxylic transport membrane protein
MLLAGLGVAKLFANFRGVRYSILGPVIFVFAAIGSLGIRNDKTDLRIMFACGVLGFIMKKFNYPIAPLIIGLVLGELTEISFRRGMRMANFDLTDFLVRPIGGYHFAGGGDFTDL